MEEIEKIKAELAKLQEKETQRKIKLANRVKRWIDNHPDVYSERKKKYNEKRSEVRRAKKASING
jgi:hypothetical protein